MKHDQASGIFGNDHPDPEKSPFEIENFYRKYGYYPDDETFMEYLLGFNPYSDRDRHELFGDPLPDEDMDEMDADDEADMDWP